MTQEMISDELTGPAAITKCKPDAAARQRGNMTCCITNEQDIGCSKRFNWSAARNKATAALLDRCGGKSK